MSKLKSAFSTAFLSARITTGLCAALCMSIGSVAFAQSSSLLAPQLRVEAGQHTAPIRRLAVDAAGQLLVTAGDDKTARVWRLQTGELLKVLRPPIGNGWEGRLYGASFSPDSATIAVAGDSGAGFGKQNQIYLFDRASGRIRQMLAVSDGPIKRLAWSQDGNYLAACSASPPQVVVFNMNAKGGVAGRDSLRGDCYGLAFSGSQQLAVTQSGRHLGIYDLSPNGLKLAAISDELAGDIPTSVAYSPDRSLLAVGYHDKQAPVELFEAPKDGTIKKRRALSGKDIDIGSLGNVAWSKSGNWLYAAGNGYRGQSQFILRRWETKDWRAADFPVANNSVTDLVAAPDDGVVFAVGDGQWGVFNGAGEVRIGKTGIADLRGPAALKISPDGLVVQWNFTYGGAPSHFDLRERIIHAGAGKGLGGADTSGLGSGEENWENFLKPRVAGIALKLDVGEASRSVARLPGNAGFILGADRSLRRYEMSGRQVWQIVPPGEARAVVATADGERLVVAFSDGSIRWYRSRDGAMLLSLMPHPDTARWVLWQPDGFYDVSSGADRMIGWHVNKGVDAAADFYPISQFRKLYHRPDVIDRYLVRWDIASARAEADGEIATQALKPPTAPPASIEQVLPPVVELLSPPEVNTDSDKLTVRFLVRSQRDGAAQTVKIRVGGVEVDLGKQVDRQKLASGAPLSVEVPLPPHDAAVLILAGSKFGYSTAAAVRVSRLATAARAAAAPIRLEPVAPPALVRDGAQRPRLFILSVGVSRYGNKNYDLGLPAKDAKDFSTVVRQQRSGKLYRSIEERVLTDQEATRAKVIEGLEWLKKNTGPTDTAILFLAGHGITRSDQSYFFLPHDVDVKQLDASAVSNLVITDLIASIRGQRLLFIDTCHAGNVLGGAKFNSKNSQLVNDLTAEENAVVVFSSSTGRQLSQEKDEWGNGAFTKVLVKGAQGDADPKKTGMVTQKALDSYLSDEVSKLTRGEQTPMTIIPFGVPDFTIFERVGAKG